MLEIVNEAENSIKAFQKEFQEKYDVELLVIIKGKIKHIPKISLQELEYISNELLSRQKDLVEGIRTRTRERIVVNVRYCFFKLAFEMGYTVSNIGRFLKFDHATVLHACKLIDNMVNTNDVLTCYNINMLKNELKERFGFESNIQYIKSKQYNPEPVLFTL